MYLSSPHSSEGLPKQMKYRQTISHWTPELGAGSSAEFLLLDFISVVIIHPESHMVDLGRAHHERGISFLTYLPSVLL